METAVKRPKITRNRAVQVYVSMDEDEMIQWAADKVGISKAAYIRMVALKAAAEEIS